MKVTPVDIHHKTFSSQTFGHNKAEVNQFLQDISRELEFVMLERNQLKETLRERDLSILEYKERDKILNETIATASKMADRLQEDAKKEASMLIKQAELNAQAMVEDTKEQLKNMYREIMELKKLRTQFDANMRALASAHLEILEKFSLGHDGVKVQNSSPNQGIVAGLPHQMSEQNA
ncbi:MAG: DivIVA domain-containing protein [Pseudobdellovibrionaceae bacterium]|jgi:cell division initiation protein